MKELIKRSWSILFLVTIFLTLFYKVFFFGQVFYDGDNFHLNIPEKYFLIEQLTHGNFPLWNPYLFTGIPYFADFNLGTLNPTNLIYFIFPVPRALTLLTVFDFFGLSLGTYLLLRFYSLSKTSSLFGAVVASLGGIPFVLFGNMTFMQVIVYIPFLFLILQIFCKKRSLGWLLLFACVQFFQFIAGHPQETYYTMLFISFYLLFFSPFSLKRRMLITALYVILPLLLASVQLLPFLEYITYANRPLHSIEYAGWGAQTLTTLVTFLFPTFYGSHVDGTWWGTQQILVGFIGIPTLLALFVGIKWRDGKGKWYYVIGLVGSFILALGAATPIFYIFYYLIPGWKLFRSPSGILVFYTFFAAILSAYGIDYIASRSDAFKKLGRMLIWLGTISTIVLGGMYFYANRNGFWKNVFIRLQARVHKHVIDSLLFYDAHKLQQMFQGILENMIFACLFTLFTGIILYCFAKKRYQSWLLLLVTLFGFYFINPRALLITYPSFYATCQDVPSALKLAIIGQYRILSLPVNLHQYRKYLPSSDFFYKEGQANLCLYQYDNNIERGIYQAAGYVSLVPKSFSDFIGAKSTLVNVTNIDFSHITQKQLNESSIRYILSREPIAMYNNISLQRIKNINHTVYIYENIQAFPRIYLLGDPYGRHITLHTLGSDTLSFSVLSRQSGYVILTDWYYPGWVAMVNGKQVPIVSYKSTFQKIAIQKGNSTVEVFYDPLSLKIGILISTITFIIGIVCFAYLRKVKLG